MLAVRLLDLFCGPGGAAIGYARAGFKVTGVDIEPQPSYPFNMFVHDALTLDSADRLWRKFDVIHASPPCQRWSTVTPDPEKHPDLLTPTRRLLLDFPGPTVIENVYGAPMQNFIVMCGSSFDLPVRRHRLFETSFHIWDAPVCDHAGQRNRHGPAITVTGSGGGTGRQRAAGGLHRKPNNAREARQALGIDERESQMSRVEASQAIPPAYTEWLGRYIRTAVLR